MRLDSAELLLKHVDELVADAVSDLLDNIPKARRRDPEALRNALERGLRSAVNEEWGKKPLVHALVIEVSKGGRAFFGGPGLIGPDITPNVLR